MFDQINYEIDGGQHCHDIHLLFFGKTNKKKRTPQNTIGIGPSTTRKSLNFLLFCFPFAAFFEIIKIRGIIRPQQERLSERTGWNA